MSSPKWLYQVLIVVITFVLGGGPQMVQAQQATRPSSAQEQQGKMAPVPASSGQASPEPAAQDQNVGTTRQSATPDPTKGPLQPEVSNVPDAPSATGHGADQQPAQAPVGAAAAQAARTAGGAASRPAGTAIAPAKQHQTRSLLIKIGAIAAGAAALGTVYGLSRSSPSLPPGARTTTASTTGH